MLSFIESPTPTLFFTGKGGVGKTSLACATAVALADAGRRVLLVSTDPASNLADVLGAPVGPTASDVATVPGLRALNVDPEAAAREYRERVVGPMRGVLPDDALRGIEEGLSGACTTEIAAFDRFASMLAGEGEASGADVVVFDTAPTGHTLRLLELPAAWSGFIDENPGGASCLGPASGLETQRERYQAAAQALRDPARTILVLVARPEPSALAEAARSAAELSALGVAGQRLVVNGMFQATDPGDPLAAAIERQAQVSLEEFPASLAALPVETLALRPHNLVGLSALRDLASGHEARPLPQEVSSSVLPSEVGDLAAIVDEVEADGKGLVLVMGKGGVGKTTVAAAVAAELAGRGHAVHLTTTDPAAHLSDTLGDDVPGQISVSRIDPAEETRRYTERVLRTKGASLDSDALQILFEDLRSPCTEEVAVFHAFSRAVGQAARGFVVMDTAPTGHTLLLLDATGSYHREVLRSSGLPDGRVTTPLMRLQDPAFTRVLVVTLAETTPVREAAALQADLQRAGVEPFAWVVNRSLAAARPTDPLLAARAAAEGPEIEAVARDHAPTGPDGPRLAVLPYLPEPPVGASRLRALAGDAVLV
ncbi:arsenical pump-driving ATPase [Rubricoccus marinus]|uniref:arsenite-transporting ATPase n=1 Tax=Rubricoccus marinus TaxID=716817 RepID=A0A259U0Q5_9BACT|nr:arsenical pump-driving ATPase [Rubricoccus marinus]OZC03561.1 arsenical pump-driving ATPase [Rubricoccus marinus]